MTGNERGEKMKFLFLLLGIILITACLCTGGCMDILAKQKVGSFGDAGGAGTTPTPAPGVTSGISASSGSSIADMRVGSIYASCYPSCTSAKKKSVHDCDKACCLAQCQPRSPEDTKRCAAICGVDLDKTTDI
jgi:hypothetical protein